jgi:hypothetical protein
MISRNSTKQKKADFIAALAGKFSVFHAAHAAGVGRRTVYQWRDADEEFAQAWEDAQADAVDALEQSLYERAKMHDTVAGIFLSKGARPHIYRDRYEVTGAGGGPLISVVLRPDEDVP